MATVTMYAPPGVTGAVGIVTATNYRINYLGYISADTRDAGGLIATGWGFSQANASLGPSLPTTLPAVPGQLWNDGGVVSIS